MTGAILPVAEIVKGRATNRLMRACGAVLPGAEGGVAHPIRRSTQARRGAGIEIGIADAFRVVLDPSLKL